MKRLFVLAIVFVGTATAGLVLLWLAGTIAHVSHFSRVCYDVDPHVEVYRGDHPIPRLMLVTFVELDGPVVWPHGPEIVDGWTEYTYNYLTGIARCKIFAPIPKYVYEKTERMDTLGHEFLHCLIGDFHPDI